MLAQLSQLTNEIPSPALQLGEPERSESAAGEADDAAAAALTFGIKGDRN